MQAAEIVTAVFGAGGLASLGLVFKAMQAKRDGFNKARAQHIEDLEKWRTEANKALREMQEVADYWRRVAADFEHQLRANGLTPNTTATKPDSAVG
ncbi:hypothetical protein AB0I84_02190 [Streptomyces spectabilis]|uniref:hypothetical protein n=1 Tax=Streptomyces spectabilis TaxID=68270 RepID=UPI0033F0CABB